MHTPNKQHLSVCLLTHNHASILKKRVTELRFAQEILVVDDNSTDGTATIAKRLGAKVYSRSLNNNFARQRNFALKMARGPWVLFIDPDEAVSLELALEIRSAIKLTAHDGYFISRIDIYQGKRILFGEAGKCKLLRLGKKGTGWWKRPVHEVWQIKDAGLLKQPLIHRAHKDRNEFIASVKRYALIEARFRYKKGMPWSLWQTISYPLAKWCQNYFFRAGFLDGKAGFWYAVIMAYHSWLVRKNLYVLEFGVKKKSWWYVFGWQMGFFGLVLMISLGQLTRIQISPTLAVYGYELWMALLTIWGIVIMSFYKKIKWPLYGTGLGVLLVLFLVSLLVNWNTFNSNLIFSASLYWWRLLLYGLFMIVIYNMYFLKVIGIPPLRVLQYLGMLFVVGGIIQYLFFPDLRWLYNYGWDDHLYRLSGTLLDPGFAGLIIGLTLILILALKTPSYKALWPLAFGSLLFTYSRSAYLAYAAGIMVFGLLAKQIKQSGLQVLLLIGCIAFLPRPAGEGVRLERTSSVEARARSMITAWDIFLEKPILGIGYNTYRLYTQPPNQDSDRPVHPSAPDNSYLFVLVTSGIVGFLGLLCTFYFFGLSARNRPEILGSLIAIGTASFVNNTLFYSTVLIWIGIMMAGTLSADMIMERRRR